MTETEFVRHACDILDLNGFMVFPQNSYVRHKGTRYRNGTSDLIVMCPKGRFYSLELKTEKGTVKQSQLDMIEKFNERGFYDRYKIVRPSNLEIHIAEMLS